MLCGGGTVPKNDGTVKGAVRWVRWYGTVGTMGTVYSGYGGTVRWVRWVRYGGYGGYGTAGTVVRYTWRCQSLLRVLKIHPRCIYAYQGVFSCPKCIVVKGGWVRVYSGHIANTQGVYSWPFVVLLWLEMRAISDVFLQERLACRFGVSISREQLSLT